MTKFRIDYIEPNLEGDVKRTAEVEFEDWTGRSTLNGVETGPVFTITALEWAEDAAYALADKGTYKVTPL